MINGIINVYKEQGYTSHDVVARLRGIVGQRKIGHTGTLDPDAVGVLPVCLGNATGLCDMMTDKQKEYEACMRLGVTTDTQDMSGRVLSERAVTVSAGEAEAAVMRFVGGYEQLPPMYSAIKINGKKLYELAREGKEVARSPRRVEIPYIRILRMELPEICFVVGCSKGTYIRALCADIGELLGCGAAMSSLKRTRVGNFQIEDAITLNRIEELTAAGRLEEHVIRPDSVFSQYNGAVVRPEACRLLLNGNRLYAGQLVFERPEEPADGALIRVYAPDPAGCGTFKAVYGFHAAEGCFKPFKMFL
ncbi:MAG: tRNA pseudouridine(55) synthase TruB [Roseburia sp.]|nr:tRNA pseudouridine(55) synthase TruB [Roseburia sp.]